MGAFHSKIQELDSPISRDRWADTRLRRDLQSLLAAGATEACSGVAGHGGVTSHTAERFLGLIREISGPKEAGFIQRTLNWVFRQIIEVLSTGRSDSASYLTPLVTGLENHTIASLNYDLLLEELAKESGTKFNLLVDKWRPGATPDQRGQLLLKLHGSIDWIFPRDQGKTRFDAIRIAGHNAQDTDLYEKAMIFGGANKLSAKGPYLDLFHVFRSRVAEADQMIIVGYGFGDDHINQVIQQWIAASKPHLIIINGPNFSSRAVLKRLANSEGRLTEEIEARLRIIKAGALEGIPQAIAMLENGGDGMKLEEAGPPGRQVPSRRGGK